MADFLQLPREVLVHILQLVEVRHRLSSCSLVHSTWAAAALAATDSIHTVWGVKYDVDDLLYWLEEYGRDQITSLIFWAGGKEVYQIPCSKLKGMELRHAVLPLHPADPDYPNMLQDITGLTRLVLKCSTMACEDSSLSSLSVLTDLQHLQLASLKQPDFKDSESGMDTSNEDAIAPLPSSLFSQLVQLTYLELEAYGAATRETFQHLGCLTDLQHLALVAVWQDYIIGQGWVPTARGLGAVSQLTQLTCLDVRDSIATFTADSAPLLTPLTNLRELCLLNVEAIDPSVMAGMTQLQHLELSPKEVLRKSAGVAALLAALQGMQQLTVLELGHNTLAHIADVPLPAAAQCAAADDAVTVAASAAEAEAAAARPYAALTASTKLQKLCLAYTALPPGAWQHIFGPGKRLPDLTCLEATIETDDNIEEIQTMDILEMRSADLNSLAQCCPGLTRLELENVAYEALGFKFSFSALVSFSVGYS